VRWCALLGIAEGTTRVALSRMVDAGELTPVIDRTFPLDQAPEAMRLLVAGKARGKIVLTV